MAEYNSIQLIGNLVENPEFRITEKEVKICKFRIASNYKKDTLFMNVVTFNKSAELCQKLLQKGSLIFVEGNLKQRTFLDKDQIKRTAYEIVANTVQFLNKLKIKQENRDDVDDIMNQDYSTQEPMKEEKNDG